MIIGDRAISLNVPPYVIAEVGVNHDGSIQRALELVDAAASAGADAVKLQLFETDRLLSRAAKLAVYQANAGATDPFKMLRKLELSIAQMNQIVKHIHRTGMHAIVTVFNAELVIPAMALRWDAFKTASPDLIHRPLLEALARTGKPLIISTGAAEMPEIQATHRWLGSHPHMFLQCVSAYPTPESCASLGGIRALEAWCNSPVGYSDHTVAIDTGALAVAAGATLLEKHLTYDRSATGPDHAASLDPAQFAQYVQLSRRAQAMRGCVSKRVLDIERDVRIVSRQSLTTTRQLNTGHVITASDLTIKRPGTGLAPAMLDEVLGRRLRHTVSEDMPLTEGDLA